MEDPPLEATDPPDDEIERIKIATQFFGALFAESDTILFRPIETWVEGGKAQPCRLSQYMLSSSNAGKFSDDAPAA